ncbi:SUKH-3 domain-containing protein [Micromonospora sp. NBC_01655]|uniref:SUKH-3 domain-containing protein n=1 Tax=Micromonospora sp. NBC_01655 TaxID=2975983 RepID=UPI002253A357|nr:SUKH-3 domain-containing protein [Micromonospora sp. NBC_01655]MCX4474232.1 SUKH-3 domain-containing protein [Micromonospora sp. NBC_01655]
MIDRQQAEQLATVWAHRDSQRLGHECAPLVEEFDLGYLITSTVTLAATVLPGDLPTTVVDKETGEVSTWPRLPFPAVREMYRRSRPERPAPRTVDPASQLLREIRRLPAPGTAAHLTVKHRMHRAWGAKGEVTLRHHRLVGDYLGAQPPGHLVRGADRHAEAIVVSDVLLEHDHRRAAEDRAPLTLDEARNLLAGSRFELFWVREAGDPKGGPAERPCDSCTRLLVHLNVLPWSDLGFSQPWHPKAAPVPDPGRFPDEVAYALVSAGWEPAHIGDELMAAAAVRDVTAVSGADHVHVAFPAAVQAITRYPGLIGARCGPGEQVWISRFDLTPHTVAHNADTLADFSAVLGHRLFPLGTEGQESIIAVDERGRVFVLDQAGEWFLGEDIDAALTTLLLGRAPARVRDDGSW